MPGGGFETRVETTTPLTRAEHGADDIEFLVSANPGQPARPWPGSHRAANSRGSAWRCRLQRSTRRTTCLVFDEVDAGIGGAVAEMVGRQLRELSTGRARCCA